MEDRILLLALRGRDALVIERLLERRGRAYLACATCAGLGEELERGAGAALITEESLSESDTAPLLDVLRRQPTWSDFPFILLSTKRSGRRPRKAQRLLEALGNVVVLERPIHSETLDSAVASALRARRRQYEGRRHLEALERAEMDLRALNGNLETRISERTEELRRANNQLMQEIAERERVQAALVQSQKMEAVGQLTGGIAHDFNNLLTVIAGNFELIERRAGDEKVATLAGYGLQASERAAKLTSQLLAFSRTDKLTLRPVLLNGLIAAMQDLLPRSLGPDHRLEVHVAEERFWTLADANQLELALLNLALNARDATPGGGTLRIDCRSATADDPGLPNAEYVVVSVSDDGPGIPDHLLEKVFDPFFTTKAPGKGTGLGLSQVYGIARQSGGAARIRNLPGAGCRVEIWLPRAGPPAAEASAVAEPPQPDIGIGYRVLVVEDDPGVRRFIVDCLRTLGFEVAERDSGPAAIATLQGDPPDLMLVDYAMPGMSGVEVIKAAREVAPRLPIILATGYADMEAVHGVIAPEHVLRKPFQIADLATAIGGVLDPKTARL